MRSSLLRSVAISVVGVLSFGAAVSMAATSPAVASPVPTLSSHPLIRVGVAPNQSTSVAAPAPAARPAAAAPGGQGYWLVAADGGIFTFGDAGYFGSTGALHLNEPIVGMATTPDGQGYWLVAADGGIFTFGDAGYFGSTGALHLNEPIVGMAATPDGQGYWLVAADGGIFTFGDAQFYGSAPAAPGAANVVAMASSADAHGYWVAANDGAVGFFGDAPSHGSLAGTHLNEPVVGFAAAPEAVSAPASPAPVSITTTSLAGATVGVDYSASLTATGGTLPYVWTVDGGSLPPGLSLSTSGVVTGEPTVEGTFNFSVAVTDATTPTPLSATATLSIVVFPAPVQSSTVLSSNWSGYVELNGPFTQISGTFTVPSLSPGIPRGDQMSAWVGIDGGDGDSTLIQAGINETPDPANPNQFSIQPWWEILPASETFIPSVQIRAGDQVTIGIGQVSRSNWQITLADDTDGETFTTDQVFSGPASTAEWIVEALTENGQVGTLAPFSPAVHFSGLSFNGSNTDLEEVIMVQDGNQVSTPSEFTADGFNVAYGDTAPPPP